MFYIINLLIKLNLANFKKFKNVKIKYLLFL